MSFSTPAELVNGHEDAVSIGASRIFDSIAIERADCRLAKIGHDPASLKKSCFASLCEKIPLYPMLTEMLEPGLAYAVPFSASLAAHDIESIAKKAFDPPVDQNLPLPKAVTRVELIKIALQLWRFLTFGREAEVETTFPTEIITKMTAFVEKQLRLKRINNTRLRIFNEVSCYATRRHNNIGNRGRKTIADKEECPPEPPSFLGKQKPQGKLEIPAVERHSLHFPRALSAGPSKDERKDLAKYLGFASSIASESIARDWSATTRMPTFACPTVASNEVKQACKSIVRHGSTSLKATVARIGATSADFMKRAGRAKKMSNRAVKTAEANRLAESKCNEINSALHQALEATTLVEEADTSFRMVHYTLLQNSSATSSPRREGESLSPQRQVGGITLPIPPKQFRSASPKIDARTPVSETAATAYIAKTVQHYAKQFGSKIPTQMPEIMASRGDDVIRHVNHERMRMSQVTASKVLAIEVTRRGGGLCERKAVCDELAQEGTRKGDHVGGRTKVLVARTLTNANKDGDF